MAEKETQTDREKIAQILAKGVLLTMEDDLRTLEAEKKAREKISPELKRRLETFRAEVTIEAEKPRVEKREELKAKPPPPVAVPPPLRAVEVKEEEIVEAIRRKAITEQRRKEEEKKLAEERERERQAEIRRRIEERAKARERARKRAPAFLFKKGEREAMRRKLQEEKRGILAILKTFPAKERPFQERRRRLEEALQSKERVLQGVLKQEKEIEEQQKATEVEEAKAGTVEKRHSLERKRWLIEQKRREIEKEKWEREEEVDKFRAEERKTILALERILQARKNLERRREKTVKGLRMIELQEEKEAGEKKVRAFKEEGRMLALKKSRLLEQEKDLETKVRIVKTEEGAVELELREIEAKEKAVPLKEQRGPEQRRWQIEAKRREAEKRRWFLERDLRSLEKRIAIITREEQEISEKERKLRARIVKIERFLGYLPEEEMVKAPEKEMVEEEIEVVKTEEKERELKPAVEEVVVQRKPPVVPVPAAVAEGEEKRITEEIQWKARTQEQEKIAKELKARQEARMIEEVREIAAREAREREEKLKEIKQRAKVDEKRKEGFRVAGPISKEAILKKLTQVSPEEEAERQEFLARVAGKEKPLFRVKEREWEEAVIFRPMVQKPSFFQKIAVRVFAIILVIGSVVAIYLLLRTYIFVPRTIAPPEAPEPEEEVVEEEEEGEEAAEEVPEEVPGEIEEAEAPQPLIGVLATSTLELSTTTDISSLLPDLFQKEVEKGEFVQVLIKDLQTKQFLGMEDLSKTLEVDFPAGLYPQIEETTFLIYSSKQGNRFGCVASLKEKGDLESAFRDWEPGAKENTENLFLMLGFQGPPLSPYFREAKYKGFTFRYQTFSKQDLGICYSIGDAYFIFATSWEMIGRVVDGLKP